jgi:hypothetical protein
MCGASGGFGKYSRRCALDVAEKCRRGCSCCIVTQLSLKPWVVAVGYEYVKLATALESFVAVCLDSGNFAGSLEVYIDESMRIERQRSRGVGKDQDVS